MNKDISFEKLQVADAAARRTGPANVTRQQQTGLSERQNPADSVLANQQPPSTSTGPPGLVSSSVAPGVSISGNPQNDETGFGTGVPVAGNHGTTTEPSSPYSNAHRYIRTPIFFAQPVPLIPNNDTEHTPSQASQGQEILTGVESSVQVETITAETVGPATHSANDTSLPTQSGGPSVGISNASRMPPKSLFGSPQIHAPRTSVPGNTSSTPPVDSFTTPGSSASTPSVGSTPTNPRRTMFSMLGDDHTSTGPSTWELIRASNPEVGRPFPTRGHTRPRYRSSGVRPDDRLRRLQTQFRSPPAPNQEESMGKSQAQYPFAPPLKQSRPMGQVRDVDERSARSSTGHRNIQLHPSLAGFDQNPPTDTHVPYKVSRKEFLAYVLKMRASRKTNAAIAGSTPVTATASVTATAPVTVTAPAAENNIAAMWLPTTIGTDATCNRCAISLSFHSEFELVQGRCGRCGLTPLCKTCHSFEVTQQWGEARKLAEAKKSKEAEQSTEAKKGTDGKKGPEDKGKGKQRAKDDEGS